MVAETLGVTRNGTDAQAFQPAWWCRNRHLQTLWPFFFRPRPRPNYLRERIELPDGDFLDLDWSRTPHPSPIVLILHGLEGCSRSAYARGLADALGKHGVRACVMHFRGTSGEPNRLARAYHSGDTADFDFVLQTLRQREPSTAFAAVGYSLGGNVLLKWLGERGADAPLALAVAVSVPFDLAVSAARLEQGLSRIYGKFLLHRLVRSARRKLAMLPISAANLSALRTIREFDDQITAPLHGFRDAGDYYARASCRPFLRGISVPTLIVHAEDDPFMSPDIIPRPDELPSSVGLERTSHGGHVGFVTGAWPWHARYWMEERVTEFITSRL